MGSFRNLLFWSPTKIYFIYDMGRNIHWLFQNIKTSCIIICTERGVCTRQVALIKQYLSSKSVRTTTVLCSSFEPTSESITKICKSVKSIPRSIIAFGGGSVIDTAKVFRLVKSTGVRDFSRLNNANMKITNQIYMVAVPTTAGTGSELNRSSVYFDEKKQVKTAIRNDLAYPDCAILDPTLLKTLTKTQRAITGFDALTHCIETFLSKRSNEITRSISLNSFSNLVKYLPDYVQSNNDETLKYIRISSTMVGVSLSLATTCLPHRIQYALAGIRNLPHAIGLRAIYPAWLRCYSKYSSGVDLLPLLRCFSKSKFSNKYKCFERLITSLIQSIGLEQPNLNLSRSERDSIIKKISGDLDADPIYSIKALKYIVESL